MRGDESSPSNLIDGVERKIPRDNLTFLLAGESISALSVFPRVFGIIYTIPSSLIEKFCILSFRILAGKYIDRLKFREWMDGEKFAANRTGLVILRGRKIVAQATRGTLEKILTPWLLIR